MVTLKRATIYNVAGALVPTLLALITIPLYLHSIGPQRFGALSAIWIICGSAGFLDLGLTRAVSYSVAKFRSEDPSRCPQIVATGLLIASLSAFAGAALIYVLARWYFTFFFKADQAIIEELIIAIPLVALTSITNVLQGVITGALQGSRNFLQANLFLIAMAASLQLGPLVSLDPSMRSIAAMMTSVLALRFLGLVFGLAAIARTLTMRALVAAHRMEVRPLLSFSKWTMGISFVGPVILFADKMLLGTLSGAASLALYNIPFQLAQRITIIPAAVSSAIFPDLVNGTTERRSELTGRVISYIYLLITLPSFLIILAAQHLLGVWLNIEPGIELRAVCGLLILAFWVNCMGQIYHTALVMMNRPATVFYTMILEMLVYVPSTYFIIKEFGVFGAAISFLALCCADALFLMKLSRLKNREMKIAAFEFIILLSGTSLSAFLTKYLYINILFGFVGVVALLALRWTLIADIIPQLKRRRRNA